MKTAIWYIEPLDRPINDFSIYVKIFLIEEADAKPGLRLVLAVQKVSYLCRPV
jgi:hypothetical protein